MIEPTEQAAQAAQAVPFSPVSEREVEDMQRARFLAVSFARMTFSAFIGKQRQKQTFALA